MRGIIIDELEIVRKIASGGFGSVWLAKEKGGNYYALKRVSKSDERICKREMNALEMYKRIASKVSNENLIQILAIRESDNFIEYVMPLADGVNSTSANDASYAPQTLTSFVYERYNSGEVFSASEVISIFKPIFETVEFLNQNGIIHRDIKPDNILFFNGKPCLADIGLMHEDTPTMSAAGTPDYKAPSWYSGQGKNGNPDMYGLATTLYFFLTGNSPDTVGRPNYMFPASKNKMSKSDISAWNHFHRTILRAMRERASERYLTVADFLKAFMDTSEKSKDVDFLTEEIAQKSTSIFLISGRINRKTFTMMCGIIYVAMQVLSPLLFHTVLKISAVIVLIVCNWTLFTTLCKRAHDSRKSIVVPFFAFILFFVLKSIAGIVIYGNSSETTMEDVIIATVAELFIWGGLWAMFVLFHHDDRPNKYGEASQRLSFF